MIGLLKYGSGFPSIDSKLQGTGGSSAASPVDMSVRSPRTWPRLQELIRQAAQAVCTNDDTQSRSELMGEGRSKSWPMHRRGNDADQRTGLFTSGVVRCAMATRWPVLQRSPARRENLPTCSSMRQGIPPPIQMCDACRATCLANCRRSWPTACPRRAVRRCLRSFSEQCRYLLESWPWSIATMHRPAASAFAERGSRASTREPPTMQQLHDWLRRQLDDKLTEPIRLSQRHSLPLSTGEADVVLRQAGALDNNVVERAVCLGTGILHARCLLQDALALTCCPAGHRLAGTTSALPVPQQVANGAAESRIGLGQFVVELPPQPIVQFCIVVGSLVDAREPRLGRS